MIVIVSGTVMPVVAAPVPMVAHLLVHFLPLGLLYRGEHGVDLVVHPLHLGADLRLDLLANRGETLLTGGENLSYPVGLGVGQAELLLHVSGDARGDLLRRRMMVPAIGNAHGDDAPAGDGSGDEDHTCQGKGQPQLSPTPRFCPACWRVGRWIV